MQEVFLIVKSEVRQILHLVLLVYIATLMLCRRVRWILKGTLSNLKVSATGTITAHGNYVGGIVGKLDTTSITNCSSSLNILLV